MPRVTIHLSSASGEWTARIGKRSATAPYRLIRRGKHGEGVVDLGRFDAIQALCEEHPEIAREGYVTQEEA